MSKEANSMQKHTNQSVVEIEDLTVSYGSEPVLWDVDLRIPEGVLMAIVGPNGAGKSTLIKAMLGLLKPITGRVTFGGERYKAVRKQIAYVPQRGSVDWNFPTTVYDVVLMGRYGSLGYFKRIREEDHRLANQAIEKLGISHLKDRQIAELSGGQQQRVFLARALAQEADIYFMDEPFQGVDIKTERAIISLLQELRAQNKTVCVVHHDLNTVEEYFDTVLLLNMSVVAFGSVEDCFTDLNIQETYRSSHRIDLKAGDGRVPKSS